MVKKIIKNFLRSKGYDIIPYDVYSNQIKKVNFNWLISMNIDAIIDVGASNGGFVKKIRPIFPYVSIISFEPLKESYQQLLLNNKEDKNFKAYNLVLSNNKGEVDFFLSSRSGCSSLLEMNDVHKIAYPETSTIEKITVKSDILDSFINEVKGTSLMLKIDVQGAEKLVLEGAVKMLNKVKVVFMEVNFAETYKDCILINDSIKLLESFGFKFIGIENVSQSVIDGSFLQGDAFFMK